MRTTHVTGSSTEPVCSTYDRRAYVRRVHHKRHLLIRTVRENGLARKVHDIPIKYEVRILRTAYIYRIFKEILK